MPDLNHPADPNQLTKEETAWLMKAIWTALQSPKWGFFNSKDLETLGKAIASGKALKDLDESLLNKIWPHMLTVTNNLGRALKQQAAAPDVDLDLPKTEPSPVPTTTTTTTTTTTPEAA